MRGTVEKRGSGYSIRYEIGRDPVTGRRLQRRESRFATKKEAEAALAKRVTETKSWPSSWRDKDDNGGLA